MRKSICSIYNQPNSYDPEHINNCSLTRGFPCGLVVKNLLANARDMGSAPGLSRSYILRSNLACVPQLLSQHSSPRELQLLKPVHLKPILEINMCLLVTATKITSIVLSLFLRKCYLCEPAVQVYCRK